MAPARNLTLSLLLLATGPLAIVTGLACGGGKPPETPADESSSGDDSGSSTAAPADSSAADTPAAAGSGASDTSAAPAASSAAPAAAAPPAAPALGDSDCGKCIDKTCAKPLAACGKATDCQSVVDAIHGCNGSAG